MTLLYALVGLEKEKHVFIVSKLYVLGYKILSNIIFKLIIYVLFHLVKFLLDIIATSALGIPH